MTPFQQVRYGLLRFFRFFLFTMLLFWFWSLFPWWAVWIGIAAFGLLAYGAYGDTALDKPQGLNSYNWGRILADIACGSAVAAQNTVFKLAAIPDHYAQEALPVCIALALFIWWRLRPADRKARIRLYGLSPEEKTTEKISVFDKLFNATQKDDEPKKKNEKQQKQQRKEQPKREFSGSIKTEKAALELLGLEKPFTAADLNKKRMEMLKKVHPDQGGSNMMARLVNEAYELLSKQV